MDSPRRLFSPRLAVKPAADACARFTDWGRWQTSAGCHLLLMLTGFVLGAIVGLDDFAPADNSITLFTR